MKPCLIVLLLAVVCSEAVALQQPAEGITVEPYHESRALVIGASGYTNGWKNLPGVRTDVREVTAVLKEHGFEVEVVEDPNSEALYRAYQDFIASHGQHPDNRLLLYFAGHGHTMQPAYGGKDMGYIVPVDAPDPYADSTGFRRVAMDMNQMEVYAERIQSRHALFVFDACFSGSVFAMTGGVPEAISEKTARPVRQFITSGSATDQVPDLSVFRARFVEGLRGKADRDRDFHVTGVELGQFLRNQVEEARGGTQTPQYGKIWNANLNQGDFVFFLSKEPPPVDTMNVDAFRRQAWDEWQAGMNTLYVQIDGVDRSALSPARKADAWQRFLTAYPGDNPFSKDDEDMRKWAQQRISYWRSQKESGVFENSIGMTFVYVEPGSFEMGSEDGDPDERPVHTVRLNQGFYMGQHEVTQAQFRAFVDATDYLSEAERGEGCYVADEASAHEPQMAWRQAYEASWRNTYTGDDNPVVCVSWNDAQAFIRWLNEQGEGAPYRLPTEAEWEYAARAGQSARFSFGNSEAELYRFANYADREADFQWSDRANSDGYWRIAPVGRLEANAWGLYDMHGNVWEWVHDRYDRDYYQQRPEVNPAGPSSGEIRVLRGGGWDRTPHSLRSANRHYDRFTVRSGNIGFRLVKSAG